jgi:hypothetical protein
VNNDNLEIAMKHDIAITTSITGQTFWQRHQFPSEEIIDISSISVIHWMITFDVINNFPGLGKSWLVAS